MMQMLKSTRTFPGARITENYDAKTGHIYYLHVSQFPTKGLPIGAILGYNNVTQLRLDCFVQDIGKLFAFAESLPQLQSIEFVNDAIVGGEFDGNSFPTGLRSKTGSVQKLKLAMDGDYENDKENRDGNTRPPLDRMQFLINTLQLLKYTRKFFPTLRVFDLVGIPFDFDWMIQHCEMVVKISQASRIYLQNRNRRVSAICAPAETGAASIAEPGRRARKRPHSPQDKPLLEQSLGVSRVSTDSVAAAVVEDGNLEDDMCMEWE